jgi:hypothetical protein
MNQEGGPNYSVLFIFVALVGWLAGAWLLFGFLSRGFLCEISKAMEHLSGGKRSTFSPFLKKNNFVKL